MSKITKEHMCEVVQKKQIDIMKKEAKNAKDICVHCGCVATDKERLCKSEPIE